MSLRLHLLSPQLTNMIDTVAHSSIRYAFQNVQKSRRTMHDLLENFKNSIDFLFIQEAPVYFIQKVPSSTSELGDDLIGPVSHRDWQCVDKRSVHPSSQVAIYVNKRLSSSYQLFPDFSPSLDPNVLVLCVRHNLKRSDFFNLVNIYNRPGTRHSAVLSLLNVIPVLSNVAVVQGDFNIHSPLWDPAITATSGLAEQLFGTFSDLELNLTNDEGDHTWTNRQGHASVIDLIFCNDLLARLSPQAVIDLSGRGRSDHAVMFLSFGRQTPHWGRPYIARDSEEEAAYLADIAAAFVANALSDPNTACTNIALLSRLPGLLTLSSLVLILIQIPGGTTTVSRPRTTTYSTALAPTLLLTTQRPDELAKSFSCTRSTL